MRFVFLSLGYHPDLIGGAYRYAAELAERLAVRGHEVEVILPTPEGKQPAAEVRAGVRLHWFPSGCGSAWNNWRSENRAAAALLRTRLQPGTLVGFHHAFFAPCRRVLPQSSVALFHGPWGLEYALACQTGRRGWGRRLVDRLIAWRLMQVERGLLREVGRICAMSRYMAEQLPKWHGAGLAPVEVISAGVDLERFQPSAERAAWRRAQGLRETDFLLVTVRRLDPRMGLLALVEAFARVASRFPQARLWLAGRGPQREELAARITSLGLADRVVLRGLVPEEELPRLLVAADAALMPSLDLEGFGLATVEALACGTPVLGSKAGATPEILSALGPGLMFEPGSVESLSACLEKTLAHPELLPSRERCRRYVEQAFTWDRPVTALERAWTELASPITHARP